MHKGVHNHCFVSIVFTLITICNLNCLVFWFLDDRVGARMEGWETSMEMELEMQAALKGHYTAWGI